MIGFHLNNYQLESLLGEGGMGMVYLARHSYMGRKAAVKVLRPELLHDRSVVARFMEEARATNAIGHPNIIDIIDVGLLPGTQTPYLMMEYLDGESLADRLRRTRPLALGEAVEIACQTAGALGAAHDCQIIHRDLKPDNLFLLRDPALPLQVRVKVLDFGIAKLRGDLRVGSAKTKSDILMGTPYYMSPEQCRGYAMCLGPRSDIYSLGVIVYEMLCGQVPFVSNGIGDLLVRHITELPPPLRAHVENIPEGVERVVLRALAKEPLERFESMAAFARALRESAAGSEKGEPEPARDSQRKSADHPSTEASPVAAAPPRHDPAASFYNGATLPSGTTTEAPTPLRTTLSTMAGQVESHAGSTITKGRLGLLVGFPLLVVVAAVALWLSLRQPESLPISSQPAALGPMTAASPRIAATAPSPAALPEPTAVPPPVTEPPPPKTIPEKAAPPTTRAKAAKPGEPRRAQPLTTEPAGRPASTPAPEAPAVMPGASPGKPRGTGSENLDKWGGRL